MAPPAPISRRDLIAAGAAGTTAPPIAGGAWISPRDMGGKGDGISDDYPALTAAIALGQPICLEGRVWRISRQLQSGDRDLTLIGPGTLLFPRRSPALVFNPAWGAKTAITGVVVERAPAFDVPVTRLTVRDPTGFARDDVVQIRSDDALPTEATTHCAELASILDVQGASIWLSQMLQDSYLTAPVLQKLPRRRLRLLQGVRFRCSEDIERRGPRRAPAALIIEGACEPDIDVEVADAPSRGVFALSCWRGAFRVRARNLQDDTADEAYGYGVSLAAASRYNHVEVQAERCRHAFTTNVYPPQRPAWFGAPRDNWVTGEAVGCSSAAFDTHPGAFDIHFERLKVAAISADSHGPGPGQRLAFQDRGVRTTLDGLQTDGFTGGIYSIAAVDPGYDYTNRYRGVRACAGRDQGLVGGPPGGLNLAGGAAQARMTVEVADSVFEGCSVTWAERPQATRFSQTLFRDVPTLRTGAADVSFRNCQRENRTGRTQEAIQGAPGGRLSLVSMHFAGPFSGAYVRTIESAADGRPALRLETAFVSAESPQLPLFPNGPKGQLDHRQLAMPT
jgi:hypothetical protein